MNKVILSGRLTKDPELKATTNQVQFVNFTLAVDRRFKDANGQRQTDFINCVAWRQTATFINQYFRKGSKIAICGSISTRQYQDNQGQNRYVTEVTVEEAEFCESVAASKPSEPTGKPSEPTMAEQAATKPTTETAAEFTTEDLTDTPLPFEI